MNKIQPPPIKESLFNSASVMSQIWAKWFNSVFRSSSDFEDTEISELMASTPKDNSGELNDIELKSLLEPTPKDYDRRLEDIELKSLLEPNVNPNWEGRIVELESGYFSYKENLADDGTFELPTIVNGASGNLVVGADEERATFTIKNDGTVNLIVSSSNIVINADTDTKFCLGTSVANPLTVKNRLGSAKAALLTLWYY